MAVLKIAGIEGGQDENGVITLIQPFHVDTLQEAFTVGDPFLEGIPRKDMRFGIWDQEMVKNGYQVGIKYEGLTEDPDEDSTTYTWSSNRTRVSIDTFPKIDLLKANFGAFIDAEGHVKFPVNVPGGGGAGAGGFARGAENIQGGNNIMFGQESWPLFGSIFTRTFARLNYSNQLLKLVGKIFEDPPGPFDLSIPDRDWLFVEPHIQAKGNAVTVTERYELGPPGGWPPHITLLYRGSIS